MRTTRLLSAAVIAASFFAGGGALADPSSTVIISEIRSRGPLGAGDEFIELFNVSNADLSISKFVVKTTAAASGSSASTLTTLPDGATIKAHSYYLLGPLASLPLPDATYGAGISDTSGVGLFTAAQVLVDAVGFSATTPLKEGTAGLTALPSTGTGALTDHSYRRKTNGCAYQDTDDNAADFELISPSDRQNSSSPPFATVDDKDACTTDMCTPATAGSTHIATPIDDGNVCTADACDPVTGISHDPVLNGSLCTDNDACTGVLGVDSCQTGVCVPGAAVTPIDDANACTTDTCNSTTGLTDHTPVGAGATCDDGNACSIDDSCNATGVCLPGTAKDCGAAATPICKDASTSETHTTPVCNLLSGACDSTAVDADCLGLGCDGTTGLCKGDPCAVIKCAAPDQCHVAGCTNVAGVAVCNGGLQPIGTTCNDGNACTLGDACDVLGACGSLQLDNCSTPPAATCSDPMTSETFAPGGVCNPASGCDYVGTNVPCAPGVCVTATGLCGAGTGGAAGAGGDTGAGGGGEGGATSEGGAAGTTSEGGAAGAGTEGGAAGATTAGGSSAGKGGAAGKATGGSSGSAGKSGSAGAVGTTTGGAAGTGGNGATTGGAAGQSGGAAMAGASATAGGASNGGASSGGAPIDTGLGGTDGGVDGTDLLLEGGCAVGDSDDQGSLVGLGLIGLAGLVARRRRRD